MSTPEKCPNCGADLPAEIGQHALVPSAGVVACPTCGETVTLGRSDADTGGGELDESFSGHETVEGVMEEIREKEDS
jgi:endogenous inhibitor of DNA gyrase (YacG/DUF329 family)